MASARRYVREVTRRAAEGDPLVVLEGDPRFYGRIGFEHSDPHGIHITLPSWAPAEAAQVMLLTAYDPTIRGRVVYPAGVRRSHRALVGGST